jgi:hypothetical protein
VSLFHRCWRARTALLAAGALDEAEAARARAHVDRCAECARRLAEARTALDLVHEDPRRRAEVPVPLGALIARVQARLDEEARAPRPRPVWRTLPAVAAVLAVTALGALVARSVVRPPGPVVVPVPVASPAEAMAVPPEALQRIERTLERERAARYLSDAQDVLVTVAAAPQRCARRHDAVEVTAEAERSRELLARRRLSVETDASATMVARDVLDDVEEMLREVAALDPCARPRDLEAIRGEIERRHLLMKIDLVTRELQG